MVFKERYHMSYCQAFLSDTLGSDTTEAALGNRKETCQSSVCTRTPHVLPEGLQEMAEEEVIVSYIHRVNYFNPALIGPDRCWSINYILDKSASLQKVCQSRLGGGQRNEEIVIHSHTMRHADHKEFSKTFDRYKYGGNWIIRRDTQTPHNRY